MRLATTEQLKYCRSNPSITSIITSDHHIYSSNQSITISIYHMHPSIYHILVTPHPPLTLTYMHPSNTSIHREHPSITSIDDIYIHHIRRPHPSQLYITSIHHIFQSIYHISITHRVQCDVSHFVLYSQNIICLTINCDIHSI